jgi:transposase
MLSPEEDVEAHALRHRGWTISAIARHLGRSRITVRAYLNGARQPGVRRRSVPDPFDRVEEYVAQRLRDDPHVWATALYDEVRALGFERSYQRFTHALRARGLRPHCEPCAGVRGRPTIEIPHPPGEEIQWDFLELPAPWGQAHLLVGALSHSGRFRGAFCESEDQGHVVAGIDAVLRKLGGTAHRWRFDRMAAVVSTTDGRLLPGLAAAAKYYGVGVDVCPPRRANRKGVVESRNNFIAQRWWRTARLDDVEQAQSSFDRFCARVGDALPRGDSIVRAVADVEHLQGLPVAPFPATLLVSRRVSQAALVAYHGNQYSVPPGLVGRSVELRAVVGSSVLDILVTGRTVATHRRAADGAGVVVRTPAHHADLEAAVLSAFSTDRPCRRKENRPPSSAALAAATALGGGPDAAWEVAVDLQGYADLAGAMS